MTPPDDPEQGSGATAAGKSDLPAAEPATTTDPETSQTEQAEDSTTESTQPVWANPSGPPSNFGTGTPPAPIDVEAAADEDDAPGEGVTSEEEVLASGEEVPPGDTLVPTVMTILGLLVAAAAVLAAFVLPAGQADPQHLPIGIVGSADIQTKAKQVLTQQYGTTTFDVTTYSNRAALTRAIDHREVYGGIVATNDEASMLISTAASLEAASKLASVANDIQLQFSNVKSLPEGDQTGEHFASTGLPLALIAIFPGIVLTMVWRRRTLAQFGAAIISSFALGIGAAAALTHWLGATEGSNFWLVGVALSAGFLSVTLLLLGLNAIGGRIALGIGVALLVLVSIPLSGFKAGPEFLPQPWGEIGQFLPFGAGGTLYRNAAFFDGLAVVKPLIVLGVWALLGLLMLGLSEGIPTTGVDEDPLEPDQDKTPDPMISAP